MQSLARAFGRSFKEKVDSGQWTVGSEKTPWILHYPLSTNYCPLPTVHYSLTMRIIDRYLLGQFIRTFLIFFLSLTGLIIVFDFFTNMDNYLHCGAKTGGVLSLMARYYGCQVFGYFERMCALLTLISVMFTVSWIQRNNEMTALMAAGISRLRIVKPLIIAAVVMSLLAAVNREVMIPRIREQLTLRPQDPLGDKGQSLGDQYDNETNVVIGGKRTFADCRRIEEPKFLFPSALQSYGKQITAANAFYVPPEGDRPGGYRLEGVVEPEGLGARPSLVLQDKRVLITPRDAPQWLKPDQAFLVSNLDFDQLTGGVAFKQYSSIAQLIKGLNNPSVNFEADVRVSVHARLVQPVLDVTLLFLGLPLMLRRESRNVFLTIGICIVVTTGFLMTVMGLQYLGSIALLPPALAAWMPLMLFIPWPSDSPSRCGSSGPAKSPPSRLRLRKPHGHSPPATRRGLRSDSPEKSRPLLDPRLQGMIDL